MPRLSVLSLAVLLVLSAPRLRADSGVGVDSWRGNTLDPGGRAGAQTDARGTSWLRPGQRRSPSGQLYECPLLPPAPTTLGEWEYAGHVQLGYLATGGDDGNALWNRYVAWDGGMVLGLLEIGLRRPADGSYAQVRASRISDDDAFFEAAFGRAGSYKVQAFLRELPNVVSDSARPLWNGVGSKQLTLLPTLTPGGSSSAEVAAAVAAQAPQRLSVVRSKNGLGVDALLDPRWSVYGRLSEERRRGARPFGGAFFYNFLFPENAGALETLRPVADSTISLNGGLRYAGAQWRMDLAYTGSFYRDRYRQFVFDSPFALEPTRPGATSAPIYRGQFALEPDNDYHNLRAAFTRRLPWRGELALTAAAGSMRQNDELIAPVACTGVFGVDILGNGRPGPDNPFLYSCADWNTPAALSRRNADLRIDTGLADARFTLQPGHDWTLRGGVKFEREDYRNTYLAYNPLTGDYGYVTENGAMASILPGVVGTWNPLTAPSAITRVRSLPLDEQTTTAHVGADWHLAARTTLTATWQREQQDYSHRERRRVDRDSVKFSLVDRSLDWLTLRTNYTWLDQGGSEYVANPYDFLYSTSLPGFVAPVTGVPAFAVDAMRKYDLADRRQHKLDVKASIALGATATLSAGLRGDWNDYGAEIGRQAWDRTGLDLQWEWQPAPATRASVYFSHEQARQRMAAVADLVFGPDGSLGGPDYPDEARWWAYDKQRNRSAGVTVAHDFGALALDAQWNLSDARGVTSYRYNSPVALAYFVDGLSGARDGVFPDMRYRVDSVSVGVNLPLGERYSLRLFDYFERGRVQDWHYLGLEQGRVIDHRVYSDGGPQSYRANLVGLLLDVKL